VRARFFAHVQTGHEAHPASYTMGTGSFPGVRQPGNGADHPLPSSAEVTREQGYTSTLSWAFESVTGYLYLYLSSSVWDRRLPTECTAAYLGLLY
jgi:hypothetical protein